MSKPVQTHDDEVEFVEEADLDDSIDNLSQISKVVLYATDWTTETVISQLKRGNIDLSPSFQRRDAWTKQRKGMFIESLVLGLPVPQIVLAEKQNERGRYLVLDGKQRLLTILQFVGWAQGKNNAFRLTGLSVRDDLHGKTFAELQNSLFDNDLDAFSNQTIRTVVIRNWPDVSYLHMVFHRLNTSSVPLSTQELRQALFPGEFTHFADDRAAKSTVLQGLLGMSEPDFRMRDVELLVRYLAFRNFLSSYEGNMKSFLDSTCKWLNQDWAQYQSKIIRDVEEFEAAIQAAQLIFEASNVGRKWLGDRYERRLNRAILDVITYYFATEGIRTVAQQNAQKVVDAYKLLCETSADFLTAVETTTKSLTATYTRLHLWGDALSKALSLPIPLPILDRSRNRIKV